MFLFLLSLKTIYIPPFKRNHKEKDYFARLDKDKSSDVDIEVSKPMSKPSVKVHKKFGCVPTCHLCGVVGHIRPNCSLLRQKAKSKTRFVVRNTDVPKFVHVSHFCGLSGHIRPNSHKLKFKHFFFLSTISFFAGFQSLLEDWYNPSNTLRFSWFFTYKAKDACCMGEKRLARVNIVYLSLIR